MKFDSEVVYKFANSLIEWDFKGVSKEKKTLLNSILLSHNLSDILIDNIIINGYGRNTAIVFYENNKKMQISFLGRMHEIIYQDDKSAERYVLGENEYDLKEVVYYFSDIDKILFNYCADKCFIELIVKEKVLRINLEYNKEQIFALDLSKLFIDSIKEKVINKDIIDVSSKELLDIVLEVLNDKYFKVSIVDDYCMIDYQNVYDSKKKLYKQKNLSSNRLK